jgi:hypothetical protein
MRRRQRCACPGDKLIGFVEQVLRHAPKGKVYGAALLLVIEGRHGLSFLEDRPVVVIDPPSAAIEDATKRSGMG